METRTKIIAGLTALVIGSGIFLGKDHLFQNSDDGVQDYASQIEDALQSDPAERAARLRGVIDAYVCTLPNGMVIQENGDTFHAAAALPGKMLIRYGVDPSAPLNGLYQEMTEGQGDADLPLLFVTIAPQALQMDGSLPGTTTQMLYTCEEGQ